MDAGDGFYVDGDHLLEFLERHPSEFGDNSAWRRYIWLVLVGKIVLQFGKKHFFCPANYQMPADLSVITERPLTKVFPRKTEKVNFFLYETSPVSTTEDTPDMSKLVGNQEGYILQMFPETPRVILQSTDVGFTIIAKFEPKPDHPKDPVKEDDQALRERRICR